MQRHVNAAAFSIPQHPEQPLLPPSQTAQWHQVKVQDFLDDKMTSVLHMTPHSLSVPFQLSVLSVKERKKDGW